MAKYNEKTRQNSNNVEADAIYDLVAHVIYGLVVGSALGIYMGDLVTGITIGVGLMVALAIIGSIRDVFKKKKKK